MKKIICLLSIFFILSCSNTNKESDLSIITGKENIIEDATLLRVAYRDDYRVMEVLNPWDSTTLLGRYILVDKDRELPSNLPEGVIVRTPIERVTAFTSVDVGSLSSINELDKVVSVCDADYILSPFIQEGLSSGKITNLGSYTKVDMEKLLVSKSELVIVSPFEGMGYPLIEKMGIPIGQCASYIESSPLGRAEWIKFYGEFFNKGVEASELFLKTKESYKSTVKMIAERKIKSPKIMVDKRYGQTWYVAAGDSYAGQIYRDAGAYYPWKEDKSKTSIALSFEKVYQMCHDADLWFFVYSNSDRDLTLNDLKAEYDSYSKFNSFKKGEVYGCNSGVSSYYEESPLRPDLLLLDYAKMFHPALFEDYQFRYFKKLK